MNRWDGKVAVVTGASSGIGASVVTELIKYNMVVIGLARRMDKLEELAKTLNSGGKKGRFIPYQADVTNEADVLKCFGWINDTIGAIHVLINNAGVLRRTNFADGDLNDWKVLFDTNVLAVGMCTKQALQSMESHDVNDGHIVNINSIRSRYQSNKEGSSWYAASKHAVAVLTDGTRRELALKNSHIKVTALNPGGVLTEIFEKGKIIRDPSSAALLPQDVADSVVYVLGTPPNVQISELTIIPVLQRDM